MKILNLTVNSKIYTCYVYLILGDWIGKYGESGAIIFCNKENHNGDSLIPINQMKVKSCLRRD